MNIKPLFISISLSFSFFVGTEEFQNSKTTSPEIKRIVLLAKGGAVTTWQDPIDWTDVLVPGRQNHLKKRLRLFLDQPLTFATIQEIKKAISDHYVISGHPFVTVNVPPQEISSGTLQLIVQESRLGSLSVEGNRYVSSKRIENYFSVCPGKPIDEACLLRTTSFINRNPFRHIDLIFAPGKEEGTTDVIIATKDRPPFRVYAGSDNLNVQTIGSNEWYAGFNWGNAFGLDHILSYQFTASFNMHVFQAHTVEYTIPLFWGHLFDIYGGYSEAHPPVVAPCKRNDGWSMQVSARYIIPLRIYQYLEHEIVVGGDFKRSNNTFEFTDQIPIFGKNVNLTQFVLGYSGNYERNTFHFDFKGSLFCSPGQFLADQTNADYASLRPGAVNHWVYFRGYFNYFQWLPKAFSFSLRLIGQGSSEPLLPSEQFGLGGYDTVRGYEEREINVDNALVMNLEARSPGMSIAKWIKPSFTSSDSLQFLLFCDAGWGVNIVSLPATPKINYLIGVGPGVRYTFGSYITARLDWGIRLHEKAFMNGNWSRLHFSVTASY